MTWAERRVWAISGAIVLVIGGCSGSKVSTNTPVVTDQYRIQKIAIVPFDTISTPQVMDLTGPSFSVPEGAKRSDMSVAIPPSVGGQPRTVNSVPISAAETVTDLVWSKLKAKSGLDVRSPDDAKRVLREVLKERTDQSTDDSVRTVAQRLGADAALTGKVLVYQERVGGRLGANPPAAVGFEVRLVAQDGTLLWEGNYYEKQRPMTEDVWGFIQRRGVFVTADELAEYGAGELAKAFPFGIAVEN